MPPTPSVAKKKWYLWSNIDTERDEFGMTRDQAVCGDEVTADSLKITPEEFQELVHYGVIKDIPYPVPPEKAELVSPVEHLRQQAAALAGDESSDESIAAHSAFTTQRDFAPPGAPEAPTV